MAKCQLVCNCDLVVVVVLLTTIRVTQNTKQSHICGLRKDVVINNMAPKSNHTLFYFPLLIQQHDQPTSLALNTFFNQIVSLLIITNTTQTQGVKIIITKRKITRCKATCLIYEQPPKIFPYCLKELSENTFYSKVKKNSQLQ